MSSTLITGPTVYPVTLAEVKANSVIEHTDDDTLLNRLIHAATNFVERYLELDLVQRTWSHSRDRFPADFLCLPKSPVLSVSSVTYEDQTVSPTTVTVSTDVYGLDVGQTEAYLYLKYGQTWPTASAQHNAVTVTYVSGYVASGSPEDFAAEIPDAIKAAILLMVDDLYMTRGSQTDIKIYSNPAFDSLLASYRAYSA